ncbi:hypothetical protein, partial [Streptomyces griseorubens]|uniref:hypothetical protein n=1 Tax=Streptomyces griseorubens TaxID=66897 RepID=UPI0035173006
GLGHGRKLGPEHQRISLLHGGVDERGEHTVGEEEAAEEEHSDQPPGRTDELDAEPADDDQIRANQSGTSMAVAS